MNVLRSAIAIVALALAPAALAAEKDECKTTWGGTPTLCVYEPNTIGYTNDSDDVAFLDFKISIRYQLFPTWTESYVSKDLGLFFAFTGRFGQYIETRESSPVVGKRFNPSLFLRYWTQERKGYFDFTFLGHESNGQSIDDPQEYQAAQSLAISQGQNPDFVNDHISRGWDYLGLVWKRVLHDSKGQDLISYVNLRYFLPWGLLQGRPEEYNTWENNPEGKPRNQVSGVAGMLKYVKREKWITFKDETPILSDVKLAVAYETGYQEIFKYNTWRFELGTKLMELPINFWIQRGYNSDLAQYYKRVTSRGVEMQIGSF